MDKPNQIQLVINVQFTDVEGLRANFKLIAVAARKFANKAS